jgi:CDP-diacylglycerol--glycerol-3-phosphate 3-phosphatidyltransferase
VRGLKELVRSTADPVARGLVLLGVSANVITIGAFLLNAAVGVLLAMGFLQLGGLLYLLFGCLDFLDGAVARLAGTAGPFGAFLDSVLDRLSEAVVFIGLMYWYADQRNAGLVTLIGLALAGSFMVSYARARAEGLGYDCEVGWLPRPERVVLLAAGLLLAPLHEAVLPAAIALLAVATAITTVQRITHVARKM